MSSRSAALQQAPATHASEPLRATEIMSVALLIARAMEVDPAYRYLFPEDATRTARLSDLFARNLRTHLPHACTHVLHQDGVCAGTVTLRPPAGVPISKLTMVRRGLLPFVLAHGPRAVERLFWLKGTYDALEREVARGKPHWHVHMMAVRSDLQGRQLGSRLLKQVLESNLEREPARVTVLTTHLPRNVVFYRRCGFEVVDERRLQPPRGEPWTVWSMVAARVLPAGATDSERRSFPA